MEWRAYAAHARRAKVEARAAEGKSRGHVESHSGVVVQGSSPAPSRSDAGKSETASRRGLSAVDYLSLCAIGIVVVLVSLPRLRAFALRENERDALRMLRVLGADAAAHGAVLRAGGLGALLAANDGHRVRLEDLELVEQGRLRRHGYLFDAAELEPGRWVLRAWPWEHGRTGVGAFQLVPGAEVHGFANPAGGFSGPNRPPPALADPRTAGWVNVPAE